MNQGKIWCVVNPTVGLPLFLGGVATISLIVHASVMSHTTWVSAFFNGGAKAKSAQATTNVAPASMQEGASFTVTPVTAPDGTTSFKVTVAPAPTDTPLMRTASAEPGPN